VRQTSPQRVALVNQTGADVEWTREDSACFGELFGGVNHPVCKRCDARQQCYRAWWGKYRGTTQSMEEPDAPQEDRP
jgi:hypothetical protein